MNWTPRRRSSRSFNAEQIAVPNATAQPLECRIEPVAGSPTSIRFTLTNRTAAPLWVLRWNTPLEGWKGTVLTVTANGTEVHNCFDKASGLLVGSTAYQDPRRR